MVQGKINSLRSQALLALMSEVEKLSQLIATLILELAQTRLKASWRNAISGGSQKLAFTYRETGVSAAWNVILASLQYKRCRDVRSSAIR